MADGHFADMVRNGLLHTFHLVTPKPRARRVDLSGRRMVVTGASPGSLGYETARTLAAWGAAVVVTALDDPAGLERTLRRRLTADGGDGDRVTARRLDLGDRGSVADFVHWYADEHSGLDVLVNNAGILLDPLGRWREPRLAPDGIEIHWRTNYLGTFQLTAALLPLLLESGRGSGDARVINVASHQHTRGRNERLFGPSDRYNSWDVYGQSKLALIHLASELQRRHGGDGFLRAVALHPGSVYTNMIARGIAATHGLGRVRALAAPLAALVLLNPEQGAQTAIHCATDADVRGGGYYERCAPARPSQDALDETAAARLWEQSQEWATGRYTRSPVAPGRPAWPNPG